MRWCANPFASASQALVSYLYSYYNSDPARARFFTSNNLALPAGQFRALGGFDTGFRHAAGEDRRLCEEWGRRGWLMRYVPAAIVLHAHDLTLLAFWRQHVNYGRAAHRFHRLRVRSDPAPPRPEPWSFYSDMLRYPWAMSQPRPLRHSALLLLSQVANAFGFFREQLRSA